jgi:hypothetical protein
MLRSGVFCTPQFHVAGPDQAATAGQAFPRAMLPRNFISADRTQSAPESKKRGQIAFAELEVRFHFINAL